jgi:antitoxin ParD1/3/4
VEEVLRQAEFRCAKICQSATFAETEGDPMGTMNISLPDTLRDFVDGQVTRGGYGTSSEYVRELIRRDLDRLALRTLLLDGAASPVIGAVDDAYFQTLRQRATAGKPKRRRA